MIAPPPTASVLILSLLLKFIKMFNEKEHKNSYNIRILQIQNSLMFVPSQRHLPLFSKSKGTASIFLIACKKMHYFSSVLTLMSNKFPLILRALTSHRIGLDSSDITVYEVADLMKFYKGAHL